MRPYRLLPRTQRPKLTGSRVRLAAARTLIHLNFPELRINNHHLAKSAALSRRGIRPRRRKFAIRMNLPGRLEAGDGHFADIRKLKNGITLYLTVCCIIFYGSEINPVSESNSPLPALSVSGILRPMCTLAEIAAAAKSLSPQEQQELIRFLTTRLLAMNGAVPPARDLPRAQIEKWSGDDRTGYSRFLGVV